MDILTLDPVFSLTPLPVTSYDIITHMASVYIGGMKLL